MFVGWRNGTTVNDYVIWPYRFSFFIRFRRKNGLRESFKVFFMRGKFLFKPLNTLIINDWRASTRSIGSYQIDTSVLSSSTLRFSRDSCLSPSIVRSSGPSALSGGDHQLLVAIMEPPTVVRVLRNYIRSQTVVVDYEYTTRTGRPYVRHTTVRRRDRVTDY